MGDPLGTFPTLGIKLIVAAIDGDKSMSLKLLEMVLKHLSPSCQCYHCRQYDWDGHVLEPNPRAVRIHIRAVFG